jgi:choline dehydrogenase-like flavoprotein
LKTELRAPGPWRFALVGFAECLPQADNRITLDPKAKDSNGLAQLRIRLKFGANENALLADASEQAKAMLGLTGARDVLSFSTPSPPGTAIHEMGGARMGQDRRNSVLNPHNQAHDVRNLFVTDGACMASSACQNPSLTYMAITARATDYAVTQLQDNAL